MKEFGEMSLDTRLTNLTDSEKTRELVASMWRATARSEKFLFGEYQELMARKLRSRVAA
jgi:hypothetical protein